MNTQEFKNDTHTPEGRALGAQLNIADNRDVPVCSVRATIQTPPSKITDITMLPFENQQDKGTCVGQGEGKGEEYRNLLETGVVTRLSKRAIYVQSKKLDGQVAQGTSPRIAAKVLADIGAPKEMLVKDDNFLPYDEYMKVDFTPAIILDSSITKVKGYAFVYTLQDLKQAIVEHGILNITCMVGDWETGMPLKPTPSRGLHRVLCYGYEDALHNGVTDTKIYIRNSWGKEWGLEGCGWFWWSEYTQHLYDMMVYTDLPNAIIQDAKSTNYQFTRTLQKGSTGTDVTELQKRLYKEIASDGLPCFRYTSASTPVYTALFGQFTADAVIRYQLSKGIIKSKVDSGAGIVGPKTMTSLNGLTPTSGKLGEWATAIQEFEGYYPGSRSYRNNNPGNIRFVGQPGATEDRNNVPAGQAGYCIFKNYNDGRTALINLLTRACKGQSQVYKPTMTLLKFYETYAPTSDNNYPTAYAAYVAKRLGVTVNTVISTLI